MASGLVALLDDIAGIAKLAAASLDDVTAAAGKAGAKAAGVVVDDTAVTPNYVVGFKPERELPIIWKIALGSIRNKLLILLPAALLLSAFAPWAVTPLLMVGGAFLCFEATEKIVEAFGNGHHDEAAADATKDPAALEQEKISGAIRTDLILSAEIMAISLGTVSDAPILTQALALAVVSLAITVAVYGVVALIVKMDDVGLHLAQRQSSAVQAVGRGLVKGMPVLMRVLSVVGTAAMLWVGGGIIVHGLEVFGLTPVPHWIHDAAVAAGAAIPALHAVIEWVVSAIGAAIVGLIVGGPIAWVVHLVHQRRAAH